MSIWGLSTIHILLIRSDEHTNHLEKKKNVKIMKINIYGNSLTYYTLSFLLLSTQKITSSSIHLEVIIKIGNRNKLNKFHKQRGNSNLIWE